MSNFFDRFKPKKGSGFQLNLPGFQRASFQGSGQSLGGALPGKVLQIQLDEPGSLGMKIEKRPGTKSAIVAMVVEGSQADRAGLQRGDILCFQGSNGQEEILYDMFRELAASEQRPLCFEVRRVETKASKGMAADSSNVNSNESSAEAYNRKQAMIAAAEKREKAAKNKFKPLPKASKDNLPTLRSTADRHRDEAARLAQVDKDANDVTAQAAAAAAKKQEEETAATLGYNPYETSRATAGQARNATVAVQHGAMAGGDATLPVTAPPPEPTAPADDDVSPDFAQAYETCITHNDAKDVASSLAILRKLMVNATTKGQGADEEQAAKFRKVRLANAKIKAAVVEVEGALDLLMSVGFQLTEDGDESVLVYPAETAAPSWLPAALRRMEQYEQSK